MKSTYQLFFPLGFVATFLLAEVQSAVAYDPQKENPPYYLTDDELDKLLNINPKTKKPDDYVRILYFHRVPGCATCQTMSKYLYETIVNQFSEEVKERNLILRYDNFENPKYQKLVHLFKISSPTLVLIQGRDGKDIKAKTLDKIWSLAGDKKAFMNYIEDEINAYLEPNPPTKESE